MYLCDFSVLPSISIIFLPKKLNSYKLEISFNIVFSADNLVRQNVVLRISMFCLWHEVVLFFLP